MPTSGLTWPDRCNADRGPIRLRPIDPKPRPPPQRIDAISHREATRLRHADPNVRPDQTGLTQRPPRTDPSTIRLRPADPKVRPPATPTDITRPSCVDQQPIRKSGAQQADRQPVCKLITARLFPDPSSTADFPDPENSTPANSTIPQTSTTAIPSKPNAKWGTFATMASSTGPRGEAPSAHRPFWGSQGRPRRSSCARAARF